MMTDLLQLYTPGERTFHFFPASTLLPTARIPEVRTVVTCSLVVY